MELTFSFLIFMTVFYAIIEFSHLLYTKVTLQNALRSAGRYMVTGRTGLDGSGNNIPRDQMIHDVFCQMSSRLESRARTSVQTLNLPAWMELGVPQGADRTRPLW